MLKTSTIKLAESRKGIIEIGDSRKKYCDSRTRCDDRCELSRSKVNDGGVRDNEVGKKNQKTSKSKNLTKSKNLSKSKETMRFSDFLTPRPRLAFTKLR